MLHFLIQIILKFLSRTLKQIGEHKRGGQLPNKRTSRRSERHSEHLPSTSHHIRHNDPIRRGGKPPRRAQGGGASKSDSEGDGILGQYHIYHNNSVPSKKSRMTTRQTHQHAGTRAINIRSHPPQPRPRSRRYLEGSRGRG